MTVATLTVGRTSRIGFGHPEHDLDGALDHAIDDAVRDMQADED
ncbi:MAG: hypothetical protein ACR2MB_16795 [Acidimicrobiales bacterium]